MKKKNEFFDVVKDCKKLIRKDNKSIRMTLEKRFNEYYDTEIISVKSKFSGKEIFTLRVETDPESAEYKLFCDNKNYVPNGWLQIRKMKRLRKVSERYAIKQYKAYVRG